jgi:hypothetical protein
VFRSLEGKIVDDIRGKKRTGEGNDFSFPLFEFKGRRRNIRLFV